LACVNVLLTTHCAISDVATVRVLYEGAELALRRAVDFPSAPLFVPTSVNGESYREAQLRVIRHLVMNQVFLMLHHLHHTMGRFDLCLSLADDLAEREVYVCESVVAVSIASFLMLARPF
jgi:hypothetical protein